MFRGNKVSRRNKKEGVMKNIISYKREIISVALISLLIFLSLSLISFSPQDNSFFYYSSSSDVVKNWCGFLGAQFAGLVFYLLGSASLLLIPLLAFFTAICLFKISFLRHLDRTLAAFLFFFSVCSIFQLHSVNIYGVEGGGYVGFWLTKYIVSSLGKGGGFVLFYTSLWVSGCFLFRVSFVNLFAFIFSHLAKGVIIAAKKLGVSVVVFARKIGIKRRDDKSLEIEMGAHWQASEKLGEQTMDVVESLEETCQQEDIFWQELKGGHEGDFAFDDEDVFLAELNVDYWKNYFVFNKGLVKRKAFGFGCFSIRNSVLSKNIFEALVGFEYKQPTTSDIVIEEEIKVISKYPLPDPYMFEGNGQSVESHDLIEKECQERAKKLEEKLRHFGVEGNVTSVKPGPIITLFEYTPAMGTKISKITALEDDLAMVLKAVSIRILAPIPGRSVLGFEISNQTRENIALSDVLASDAFEKDECLLPAAFGVDIVGNPVVEDLVKMPHLLVAGSTGSGKSVGLNVMLMSLLCKLRPEELKLILVDPKRLEFSSYRDIPHLLFPIITEPRKVPMALKWVVMEMEKRYEIMARFGVKNLKGYHDKQKDVGKKEAAKMEKLPFIVVMIDELADLMIVVGKDVETYITRIAQMARAAGIHMVIATQRPSVDVLTGLIKVNFPSRLAFRVSSKIDSKTILDSSGAERLLGRGDMLYLNPRYSDIRRVHGAFVTSGEINKLADYLRSQRAPQYLDLEEIVSSIKKQEQERYEDELLDEVMDFVQTIDEVSISMIQRKYRIGFNRSARIIEELEVRGILAPSQGSKPRKVLR